MKARVLIALLFLIAVPTGLIWGQSAQLKAPEELQTVIEQLDKAATEMVKDPRTASFTLGLVQKGGLVWTKSYGYADIDNKKPATADTVYRVGSITKQFTALMLLQLVHEGKVHLSDPVDKYFPEIHQVKGEYKDAPPITLLQLASHTSGLDSEPEPMEIYVKGPLADWKKRCVKPCLIRSMHTNPGHASTTQTLVMRFWELLSAVQRTSRISNM